MTEAYIYDAVRTPRGKGRKDGSLHEVTSARLSAGVLNALKERNDLDGHAVEDVIWGNVTQVGEQGGCLARTAVLASDLDESIPGLAINRFCASGMEAVNPNTGLPAMMRTNWRWKARSGQRPLGTTSVLKTPSSRSAT